MHEGPPIATIAALVGEPARATMLASLMGGRAQTASELAYVSRVTPQTASGHLKQLSQAGLLVLTQRGRYRYFELASPLVAQMLEALMVLANTELSSTRNGWRGGETLRNARTCYDHLAGRLAVQMTDRFLELGYIRFDPDGGKVTPEGLAFLDSIGLKSPARSRRVFCLPCVDWSERRPHVAGILGASLLDFALERGWIERIKDSRALVITPNGRKGFEEIFDLDV